MVISRKIDYDHEPEDGKKSLSDASEESPTRVVVELIINSNCRDKENYKNEADLHDVVNSVHQDNYKRSQERVNSHVSVGRERW